MDQVVQVYVDRKILVNANGDRFHQRKVLQHDPVAQLLRDLPAFSYGHTDSGHVRLLTRLVDFRGLRMTGNAA
jgi:hypothetical protein